MDELEESEKLARLMRIWPSISPDLRMSILHFAIDLLAIQRVQMCEAIKDAHRSEP